MKYVNSNRTARDTLCLLIPLKLHASRTTDIGDIARMLGLADEETRARVREVVERYPPEDSDDLEALILLGEQEIDPPE